MGRDIDSEREGWGEIDGVREKGREREEVGKRQCREREICRGRE